MAAMNLLAATSMLRREWKSSPRVIIEVISIGGSFGQRCFPLRVPEFTDHTLGMAKE